MEDMTCRIKCDVEIDVSGPTDQTVVKWTADTLRGIADRLERDEFEDGHHTATDRSGRPVGTVYFDFYATDP